MWCRFAYVVAVTLFGAFAQTPCEQVKMLKLTGMVITKLNRRLSDRSRVRIIQQLPPRRCFRPTAALLRR